ncbi:MAG TPA: DUF6154 family protein [Chondromyces sp.]|nr:DUF6154 family protein [Chondromyces sp.]
MKLIDELFEIYRDRLEGSDEDLDMITLAVIEQLSHSEILGILKDMSEEELQYVFHSYLLDALKRKFAQEDLNDSVMSKKFYH